MAIDLYPPLEGPPLECRGPAGSLEQAGARAIQKSYWTNAWALFFIQLKEALTTSLAVTAEFLLGVADGGVPNGRVVTDTSTVTWDLTTVNQAKATAAVIKLTNPTLAAPSVLTDGDAWVECSGVTPNRTASLNVRDGGVTITIATVTY